MLLVSSCSRLCQIHWSQPLSAELRCSWSSADRRCSNYIWAINNFIAYLGATYIRDFTVSNCISYKIMGVIIYPCPNHNNLKGRELQCCCKYKGNRLIPDSNLRKGPRRLMRYAPKIHANSFLKGWNCFLLKMLLKVVWNQCWQKVLVWCVPNKK